MSDRFLDQIESLYAQLADHHEAGPGAALVALAERTPEQMAADLAAELDGLNDALTVRLETAIVSRDLPLAREINQAKELVTLRTITIRRGLIVWIETSPNHAAAAAGIKEAKAQLGAVKTRIAEHSAKLQEVAAVLTQVTALLKGLGIV